MHSDPPMILRLQYLCLYVTVTPEATQNVEWFSLPVFLLNIGLHGFVFPSMAQMCSGNATVSQNTYQWLQCLNFNIDTAISHAQHGTIINVSEFSTCKS